MIYFPRFKAELGSAGVVTRHDGPMGEGHGVAEIGV